MLGFLGIVAQYTNIKKNVNLNFILRCLIFKLFGSYKEHIRDFQKSLPNMLISLKIYLTQSKFSNRMTEFGLNNGHVKEVLSIFPLPFKNQTKNFQKSTIL